MKRQGCNLSIRLRGEDVNLLQTDLRQCGLSVAKEEADATPFGPARLAADQHHRSGSGHHHRRK